MSSFLTTSLGKSATFTSTSNADPSYFNGWSWWIDERPFRADWAYSVSTPDPQTRTQHYSPLLHNAILSVVSLFIDAPEARRQSQACAVRAASLMEGEAERGMCSTVRGLLFLGSHHWAHNKRSTAWLYEGENIPCSICIFG
jgi:hypothetical protein